MDMEKFSVGAEGALAMIIPMISTWGIRVLGALALLIVGRIAASWMSGSVRKGLAKAGTDASLIPFFSSMTYYVVLAVVVIAVLNLFGIETTSLIAVLGAASLAVGLPCRERSRILQPASCF